MFDQVLICNNIPSVFAGPWIEELKKLNIFILDMDFSSPIEILIGADVAGKLYTRRRLL